MLLSLFLLDIVMRAQVFESLVCVQQRTSGREEVLVALQRISIDLSTASRLLISGANAFIATYQTSLQGRPPSTSSTSALTTKNGQSTSAMASMIADQVVADFSRGVGSRHRFDDEDDAFRGTAGSGKLSLPSLSWKSNDLRAHSFDLFVISPASCHPHPIIYFSCCLLQECHKRCSSSLRCLKLLPFR